MNFPGDQLSIGLDFGDLASYLAIEPTRSLCRETSVGVNLLPIDKPPVRTVVTSEDRANDPLAAYRERRARARDRYRMRELQRHCDFLGLTLEQGGRKFDTSPAALGLLWMRAQNRDVKELLHYTQAVFEAAFRQHAPVEELTCIVTVLAAVPGMDTATNGTDIDPVDRTINFLEFATIDGMKQLARLKIDVLEFGILETPAFWYGTELFQGRQHLPRLAWLLNGSVGPSPV